MGTIINSSEPPDWFPAHLDQAVYSNLDHELRGAVADALRRRPGTTTAAHAARSFCGYVSWDADSAVWRERVSVDGVIMAEWSDADLASLIARVNERFGHD